MFKISLTPIIEDRYAEGVNDFVTLGSDAGFKNCPIFRDVTCGKPKTATI